MIWLDEENNCLNQRGDQGSIKIDFYTTPIGVKWVPIYFFWDIQLPNLLNTTFWFSIRSKLFGSDEWDTPIWEINYLEVILLIVYFPYLVLKILYMRVKDMGALFCPPAAYLAAFLLAISSLSLFPTIVTAKHGPITRHYKFDVCFFYLISNSHH